MDEKQLRKNVAEIMNAWSAGKRGSREHKEVLSIYNGHKPLARGYAVKESDAYCATAVSAAYIKAGIAEYTGTECSVPQFIEVAKQKGIWQENDAYKPGLGDACCYDWQDNGMGDNKGSADHIGIVTAVNGNAFTVTEGNMSGGKFGKRTMNVNGRYIRGFIAPNFAAIAKKQGATAQTQGATASGAAQNSSGKTGEEIYIVKAGDTLAKIAAAYKTTYQALASYNGIANPNKISVGQAIRIPGAATREYTVKAGESLWSIAAAQLGNGARYNEIKTLNGLKNNTIRAGQALKLPKA